MNRGVYSAATGMIAAERWLDVVSHNLANVSTVGFKREELSFNEGLLRRVRENAGDGDSIGEIGAGPVVKGSFTVFHVGAALATGNPLDLALRTDKGMFAVQTPQGVKYTRDGALSLNSSRQLVNKSGLPVLDRGGSPITLPAGMGEPKISASGAIEMGGETVGQIGVFDGQFTRWADGLFESANASVMEESSIQSGAVEASNVNAIEEMIAMIRLNRAFEMSQKSIQSQDESTGRLLQAANSR